MSNRLVSTAILLTMTAIGWPGHPAWAETATIRWKGIVTSINPDTIDTIGGTAVVEPGDKISGQITYDLDAPGEVIGVDGQGNPIEVAYPTTVPPGAFSYSVGGFEVTSEDGDHVGPIVGNNTISNIFGGISVDAFVVGFVAFEPLHLEHAFRLEDTTQSVFEDTSLPTELDLKDFDQGHLEVFIINDPDSGFADRVFTTSISRLR